ncbi:MAG: glycosyltransferase [Akkermansia sp.]|nr:glycosyltransferase [Akkermansia sp.]
MSTRPARIYTCTPVAFHGNASFFTRDTGLICHSLQEAGIESRPVMPLPAHADDLPGEVLRVPPARLRSAAWWRSLGLDGVVLYSWGDPRYTAVAAAIKRAGIRLVIHYDANCELHEHLQRPGGALKRLVNRLKDAAVNRLRARHLAYADAITCPPPVAQAFRTDPYYGRHIAARCVDMPCPVSGVFRLRGEVPRERLMVAVGRWDDVRQKRPEMLTAALDAYYAATPPQLRCQTEIYGTATDFLRAWHAALPADVQACVSLQGRADQAQLACTFNRARCIICPSLFEGSHNVSAEALCCGCAVVCACQPVLLCTVMWYTTQDSGTIAAADTPAALAAAMAAENAAWDAGLRHPQQIAATWQARCYPTRILPRLLLGN